MIILTYNETTAELAAHLPAVTVDFTFNCMAVDAILADYENGAYQATQMLLEAGHQRIALLRGRPGPRGTFSHDMYAGFSIAFAEKRLPLPAELICSLSDSGTRLSECSLFFGHSKLPSVS